MLSAVPTADVPSPCRPGSSPIPEPRDDRIGLLRHARHIYKLPRPFLREAKTRPTASGLPPLAGARRRTWGDVNANLRPVPIWETFCRIGLTLQHKWQCRSARRLALYAILSCEAWRGLYCCEDLSELSTILAIKSL